MAIKKAELLTADANQDILYPRTSSDIVIHGNSTVDVALGEKVDKTQVSQEAIASSIVERNANANINIGKRIAFNDINAVGNAYIGGIGIGSGTSNGVPFVDQPVHVNKNVQEVQIWTSETAPIDVASTVGTIPKRDNERKINAHALVVTENNDETPKGQYSLTQTTPSGIGNGVNFPMWYDFEALQGQGQGMQIWTTRELPIEEGDWTPIFTASQGGQVANITAQTGKWFRRGDTVTCIGRFVGSGIAVPFNGELWLSGLPHVNVGMHTAGSLGTCRGISPMSTGRQLSCYIRPGQTHFTFSIIDTNNMDLLSIADSQHLNPANNFDFLVSATYEIAKN